MTRTLTLRKIGNSIGATFPKEVLDRHGLKEGSTLHLVETPDGLTLTPYDPDFEDAIVAYEDVAERYKNALRELAK